MRTDAGPRLVDLAESRPSESPKRHCRNYHVVQRPAFKKWCADGYPRYGCCWAKSDDCAGHEYAGWFEWAGFVLCLSLIARCVWDLERCWS